MFKFNFQSEDFVTQPEFSEANEQVSSVYPCEEVAFHDVGNSKFNSLSIENFKYNICDLEQTEKISATNFLTTYKNCDVIPSIYEGGLKIWECTYDLLIFLMHNEVDFQGKTVLDLGCGSGLLGIYAASRGAEIVHFQDYNEDVLRNFTVPNVRSNNVKSQVKFISGDWGNFVNFSAVSDVYYDYILSSETLYNVKNYFKLCTLIFQKLHSQGKVFLASKSYYFGVGGSVNRFKEFLDKEKLFYWETAWKNIYGVQREILIIKIRN